MSCIKLFAKSQNSFSKNQRIDFLNIISYLKYIFSIKIILLWFSLVFLCPVAKAQFNDAQAALYNIGSHALFSGIGALINKDKEDEFVPTLLKGMGIGAAGGILVYSSKKIAGEFVSTNNYGYLWASKLVNAAGNSLAYNAALNEPVFGKWQIYFGFNRFELNTKNRLKLSYKII